MNISIIIASSLSIFLGGINYNNRQSNHLQEPIQVESYTAPCLEGEDEDPEPIVSGDIRDNSIAANPVYHACVELKTTGGVLLQTIGSNLNGHYYFNSISPGSYNLVVSASGFTTQTIPITVGTSPQIQNVTLY